MPTFGEHGVWLGAGWWYWQESVNSYTGNTAAAYQLWTARS